MIEMPPKLWLPPKPAIVRAASLKEIEQASVQFGPGFLSGRDFAPDGVNFNGSTYLRGTGALNVADGPAGTLSYWATWSSLGAQTTILSSGSGTSGTVRFNVAKTSGNDAFVQCVSSSDANKIVATATTAFSANTWYHVLVSWNNNAGGVPSWRIYIDDAAAGASGSPLGGNNDYTQARWQVGADVFNNARFHAGNMAELFFIPQFLDLTVTANRRKFIRSNGKPEYLGFNGSYPFGVQPTIYLSGNATDFLTNRGSGGALAVQAGSLTTSSTKPG